MTSTSGEPITNFGESDVTVSLTTPYPIGSVVYNGTEAHEFTCVANTSGTYDVSFTTTHFSEFVLNGASVMVGENDDVKYYVSFADAFKGLNGESGKITILDSHETAGVVLAKDQKISVDLNGKVLSLAQSYNNLMEVGSDAGVASIEIDATEDGSEIVAKRVLFKASEVSSKFNLTVDGGKYTFSYAFIIYGAHDVVFKDATFDVTEAAVWCGNEGPDTIKVSNCNVDSEDVGLYLGTIKDATLENNTVVSENTAVEIKSGVVKITGGSYTCSVYEKGGPINGNGTGAGTSTIVINNGYAHIPNCGVNVSISGVALSNKAEGTHSPILIVTGPNNYNIVVTCDGKYIPDCFANTGAPGKIIYNNVEKSPEQVGSTTA